MVSVDTLKNDLFKNEDNDQGSSTEVEKTEVEKIVDNMFKYREAEKRLAETKKYDVRRMKASFKGENISPLKT